MHHLGAAFAKELLDLIQRGRSERLEQAEPESLRRWRVDSIEDNCCSRTRHPRRRAFGMNPQASLCELRAGIGLRCFQPSC